MTKNTASAGTREMMVKGGYIIINLQFRYKGRLYDRCVTHANQGIPWCATGTDNVTLNVLSRGNCSPGNKVNDCPVGFRWAYSEATCYRVKLCYNSSNIITN